MKFLIKFIILTALMIAFVLFFNQGDYVAILSENAYKSIGIFMGVLVLLNLFLKPILKVLALPFNCLTMGLFSFVVNFIVVYMADYLVQDFAFRDWKITFIFSLVFAMASSIIDYFTDD